MKQTLFTKQLAEYFNIYLPINKSVLKYHLIICGWICSIIPVFKEIKGIPHYRIDYSDITTKDHG